MHSVESVPNMVTQRRQVASLVNFDSAAVSNEIFLFSDGLQITVPCTRFKLLYRYNDRLNGGIHLTFHQAPSHATPVAVLCQMTPPSLSTK